MKIISNFCIKGKLNRDSLSQIEWRSPSLYKLQQFEDLKLNNFGVTNLAKSKGTTVDDRITSVYNSAIKI